MTLRYLHAISSVAPKWGGPVEGLRQLTGVNTSRGHHIEVVSLDSPEDPWTKDFPVPLHPMGPAVGNYGYTPRLVPWLKENRHRFDAVVVNGLWRYNGLGTRQALCGTSTPYVVFTHGMLDPWFKRQYPLKHLKKWLYWPWADYRVLRDAAAVLFTSEQERLLARDSFWLYRAHERVVKYGTSGPSDDSVTQIDAFRSRFPELAGKRFLIFLGRVHPKKGADLLLRAYAQKWGTRGASDEGPLLVIAGPDDHPYASELKALADSLGIAAQITWTGMLQGDLKWGALRAAEAFVLPSHQENFGIAVAEALACGTPVLISEEVNIWREVIADGAGFAAPDTLEGAGQLLLRWGSLSAAERLEMRERARACFLERFHIERAAESLLEVLHAVSGKPPVTASDDREPVDA